MDGVKPADSVDFFLSKKPRDAKPRPGHESASSARETSRPTFAQMLKKTSENKRSSEAPSSNNRSADSADRPSTRTEAAPTKSAPELAGADSEQLEERREVDDSASNGSHSSTQAEQIPDIAQPHPVNESDKSEVSANATGSAADAPVADLPGANPELLPVSTSDLANTGGVSIESAGNPSPNGALNRPVSATETSQPSESFANASGENSEAAIAPGIEQFAPSAETGQELPPGVQLPASGFEEGRSLDAPLDPSGGSGENQVPKNSETTRSDQQQPLSIASSSLPGFSAAPGVGTPSGQGDSLRPVAPLQHSSATGEIVSSEMAASTEIPADFVANLQDALTSGGETNLDGKNLPSAQPAQAPHSSRPAGVSEADVPTASSLEGKPTDAGNAEGLANRIGTSVAQALNGGKVMRMRMHPPELGILQIEVTSTDGTVTARLDVENARAHRAILENLPQLREMLNKTNTQVERIELNILDSNTGLEGSSSQSRNPASQGNSSGRSFSPSVLPGSEPRDSQGDSGSLEKSRQRKDRQSRSIPLSGIDIQV